MKISLLCENVNKKISLVNHAVSTRSQLPVLLNFLLKAEKGRFIISATDLEIGIEVEIPAGIEEDGAITIPAKLFYELVTGVGKGKATLYTEGETLHLDTEKTKTTFQTIKADEFPSIYEEKGELIGSLGREEIEKNIPGIVFSASLDTGRPALSGVLMGKDKNKSFFMVATDGYRLSIRKETSLDEEDGDKYLIPARIIKELALLRDEGDVSIYISQKSNQVLMEQGGTVLAGRLIEAEFPNYQKIIPDDYSSKIVIDKEEFLSAVKTCSIFARETANIIKFSLEKKKLVISSSAPSAGETTVDVEAVFEGEENEIAFNARYILDFLANTGGEKVVIEMTGPLNPGAFKIEGDPDFLHIIMPIRVQS